MPAVTQAWTHALSFMQQSVLLAAIRGPDGIHKNHVSKKLCRWLRRCVVISAFEKKVLDHPALEGGGSFTGPSLLLADIAVLDPAHGMVRINPWGPAMHQALDAYMLTLDEVPHHFQLHFLHAAEILGYTHPDGTIRTWWEIAYLRLCNDMHLNPESREDMMKRLGDNEEDWRRTEEVRAD